MNRRAARPAFLCSLIQHALATFLSVAVVSNAVAQEDQGRAPDPLSYERTLAGYDAAAAQKAAAEHFAGLWRVTVVDEGKPVSGEATVAEDGSSVALVLNKPDGEVRYRSVEIDAMKYEPGTGPFAATLGVRFKKENASEEETAGQSVTPLYVERDKSSVVFKLDDQTLDLGVDWTDDEQDQIQMRVMSRGDMDKLQGRWAEEAGDSLKGGGVASWIRGDPEIAGVLVLDNQLDASAGYNYPFRSDGTPIDHVKDTRTLVVYGANLPKFADGADIASGDDTIEYIPDFRDGEDRERAIQSAYEKAGVKNTDDLDAFIVTASLKPGVKPGSTPISVNGAKAEWPLVFANAIAIMRFVRGEDMATDAFYPGDIGYVAISFEADLPIDEIPVSISRGEYNKIEDGVLLARPAPGESPVLKHYRTDPIHFYHRTDKTLSPPPDENALRVPVLEGTIVTARLVDPAQALTAPPVAKARIFKSPDQLGSLWKDALDRVAACHGDTIDDYEAYQREKSTDVSNVILAELGRRNISLSNGDHAAAILIRDEFVKLTLSIIPKFEARARNRADAVAYRERAKASSAVANEPFWRLLEATYVEKGWFFDSETTMPLSETLDEQEIAKRFNISEEKAKAWAEDQTAAAAKKQVELMENAVSTAQDAGDCDMGELLLIAGHRSPPVIARILPRLVKQDVDEGPPLRKYWTPDTAARGYVKGLYITGDAVRAMEQYAEADTNVALAVAALATLGSSAVLEGLGYAGAALWTSLAADAVDMGMGALGVEKYFSGEDYYDFARGAAHTLGDGVLDYAISKRQSPTMTALGVLLPTASAGGTMSRLRYFKNVERGKALFHGTENVLDGLSSLSDAERTSLAGYYADLLAKARKSGVNKLDEADRAALNSFQDYFSNAGVAPPSLARTGDDIAKAAVRGPDALDEVDPFAVTRQESPPTGGSPLDETIAEPPPAGDPRLDETIAEAPPVGDPRLDPSGRNLLDILENAPVDDSPALPPPTNMVPDLAATRPGSLSNDLSAEEIQHLFDPGAELTQEQIIQKADLIRSGRVPAAMAQGDPQVLSALDNAFGLNRERPLTTSGGTIIEPAPNASALDDTVNVPPPSATDDTSYFPPPGALDDTVDVPPPGGGLDDTVEVPPPSATDDTSYFPPPGEPNVATPETSAGVSADAETVIDRPSSAVDPNATLSPPPPDADATLPPLSKTVPPGEVIEGPVTPRASFGEAIDGALQRNEDAALRDLAQYQPGAADRLGNLNTARRMLEAGEPSEAAGAERMYKSMTQLGVPEEGALSYDALHYRRPEGDFSAQMKEAHIVAEAVAFYGQHTVTARELAAATGISPTAAQVVIEDTFKRLGPVRRLKLK